MFGAAAAAVLFTGSKDPETGLQMPLYSSIYGKHVLPIPQHLQLPPVTS